jgi:hypothetical protein
MNRILAVAVLILGAWYLWRKFGRALRRARGVQAPAKPRPSAPKAVTLERDPVTGVFRPPEG